MFNSIITFCNTNPVIAFTALIATFVSVFLSCKALSNPKLSYKQYAYRLVQNDKTTIPNLKITYNDTIIQNLTITNFVIWNQRYKSIRKSDIVMLDHPRFISESNDTEILDIRIIQTNKVSNNCCITPSESEFNFSFDFLGKKNGAVIQIIHTGTSNNIKFIGDIIDGKIKNESIDNNKFLNKIGSLLSPEVSKIIDFIGYISLSILLFLLGIFAVIALTITPLSLTSLYLIFILLMILFFYIVLYRTYLLIPRSLSMYSTFNIGR